MNKVITNHSLATNLKEKVPTVPETLVVSNVVQEKDNKSNEKSIFEEYSSGTFFIDHRHDVTRNDDTLLVQPVVPSPVDNVKFIPCIGHKKSKKRKTKHAAYYERLEKKLPGVNEKWNRKYADKSQTSTTKRRVSFANESVATVLYSEVESEYGNNGSSHEMQWMEFISILLDKRRNFGILPGTKELLLDIAHECKDDGLDFSFATIQSHVCFRRITRHLLAKLVKAAGGNVSVVCPLEQPGRDQRDGGNVAAEASRDAKYTMNGIPVLRDAVEGGRRWEVFYGCCSDSDLVSKDQMNDLGAIVSRFNRTRGLCDCNKKSVELFCKRAGWPQQLIDDILDLFHKVLEKEAAFAAEMNQLCLALSKLTIVSLELPSPSVVVSGDGGGGSGSSTASHCEPHVTFDALVTESKSLSIGGSPRFSLAARLLLNANPISSSAVNPQPTDPSLTKAKASNLDDDTTHPLGFEWHIDDKNRRVRRSLRIQYRKERKEALRH